MKETYSFRGKSTTQYTFELARSIEDLPNGPGVYVMLRIPTILLMDCTPLYWGVAVDQSIKERLTSHERTEDALRLGRNCFGYLQTWALWCEQIEKDLIEGNPTPLNKKHNNLNGLLDYCDFHPLNALATGGFN